MISCDAKPGDVIYVHHSLLLVPYVHYGVYVGDNEVIHYGNNGGSAGIIRSTDIQGFLDGTDEFFRCSFPSSREALRLVLKQKGKNRSFIADRLADFDAIEYHIYSPEETIERARAHVGMENYSLWGQNCEHFARWCKTGVGGSTQINTFFDTILG